MKEYISPIQFSKKVDLSYDQVLRMCKLNEIETIRSQGGHFKIPIRELDRFTKKNESFISREQYEFVIRENERLKMQINQIKALVTEISVQA